MMWEVVCIIIAVYSYNSNELPYHLISFWQMEIIRKEKHPQLMPLYDCILYDNPGKEAFEQAGCS